MLTWAEQVVAEVLDNLREYYPALDRPGVRGQVHAQLVQQFEDTGNAQRDYERLRDRAEVLLNEVEA